MLAEAIRVVGIVIVTVLTAALIVGIQSIKGPYQ